MALIKAAASRNGEHPLALHGAATDDSTVDRPTPMTKTVALPVLLCALVAHAQAPPLDPWTDAAWQDVLYGLPAGQVLRVRATQQLFDIHAAASPPASLSRRELLLEFEAPGGRVSRLTQDEQRRGEARSSRSWRYVYEEGRLARIEEIGHAAPALARRYDAAGRPVEQTERVGALTARTTWRYDAAGRLLERTQDNGGGSHLKETRRYRRDGTLERIDSSSGALLGRRIDFDSEERPVRIQATDVLDRQETLVTYPGPTETLHATTGFALTREGAGRYAHSTLYRVRAPQELRGVEAPALPTLRRHVRGAQHDEVQTEFDAAGRVLVERRIGADGKVACSGRIDYHPAGPPLALRNERAQPDAACPGSEFDNEVRTDAQGHWSEQRMVLLRPDGQRRLASVQTRQVELARASPLAR